MTLVIDCSGAGLAQVDVSLALQLIPIMLNYYPGLAKAVYMCDLPWVCKAATNVSIGVEDTNLPLTVCGVNQVCLRVLPARIRELVNCCDRKVVLDLYSKEHCPQFFGGCCDYVEDVANLCPDDAVTLEKIGQDNGE